ncbi:MAG: Ig-like domain repeat protein [Methanobrevibacter thaueri]|jgi:hypothetical protein|uniref:Ig-like domain-containing protein n=1 Tax=Methanobrevibacter thaueri TaxID=190975 RepID=UPI0026EF92BF|nr:Ig-like domain-containing protein [Methanobrevibacter thaueri]MBE6495002.1 Ig-like domain repeat protein [Methanobrevibacter thaueri]
MKINKLIIFSLILLVGLTFIGSISAQDSDNVTLSSEIDDIIEINDNEEILDDSCCEDETGPKTWTVEPDPENPNQVQKPTVQPVIDAANPGDTIVLNGTFVHCHFMINKTLNIIATPGTSVGVCPHHTHMMKYGTGPEENGIFYISPEANGTVLSGFSFTNDFYYIANNIYNPFGVYVDADDVVLENLTFNWVGVAQQTSKYNPEDFQFNAIILNNTNNTLIRNIVVGNVNSFINSINASNINSNNISAAKEEVKQLSQSSIAIANLNILAGDAGNLQVTLKDSQNNPLSNRTVVVIIDGVSKEVVTDGSGVAKLSVKYSSAGTHYVTVSFAGDDDYKSSIGSSKIVVSKKSTTLKAPKATLKVKKAKKISITLKSNGKAIANKKITLKVNGKTFSAKTNSKGVASIKVKVTKKGSFKYTAKFAGDGAYKAVSKTGKIVVEK